MAPRRVPMERGAGSAFLYHLHFRCMGDLTTAVGAVDRIRMGTSDPIHRLDNCAVLVDGSPLRRRAIFIPFASGNDDSRKENYRRAVGLNSQLSLVPTSIQLRPSAGDWRISLDVRTSHRV